MKPHINELIATRLSRRSLLKATSAAALVGCSGGKAEPAKKPPPPGDVDFKEISTGYDGQVHWPTDTHACDLVVSWGDPLFTGAPDWEGGQTTAGAQALQFGDSNDFIAYSPLPKGTQASDHGVLTVNHEFTRGETMFVGHDNPRDVDRVRAEMAGHGMSVVEVQRTDAGWGIVVGGALNRRITLDTPFKLSGPVAGHRRVRTSADPAGATVLGTMANCAGGVTPWGTVLSGEENIHVYWSGDVDETGLEAQSHRAMSLGGRQVWHFAEVDRRFDLAHSPNEPNRFGWVVEVDPYDSESVPKKRTALGRFFHEGAEVVLDASGRVVVYMGDDSSDEHLYRFVSDGKYSPEDPSQNRDLLDTGVLYVAVFDADGLRWVALQHEGKLADRFESLADILIDTRTAAKVVGATPMDRPERIAVSPKTGLVYVMLTKNPRRTVADGPNPRAGNLWGQILEIDPGPGGHASLEMTWAVMLEGGPPATASSAPAHQETTTDGLMACPDNCAFDHDGRLWVTTDGNPGAHRKSGGSAMADGLYVVDTEGALRGRSRLFFRACVGAEVTGPCFTPDSSTLFLSVQHPGRGKDGDPETSWPAETDPAVPARSTIVALRKQGNGPIL